MRSVSVVLPLQEMNEWVSEWMDLDELNDNEGMLVFQSHWWSNLNPTDLPQLTKRENQIVTKREANEDIDLFSDLPLTEGDFTTSMYMYMYECVSRCNPRKRTYQYEHWFQYCDAWFWLRYWTICYCSTGEWLELVGERTTTASTKQIATTTLPWCGVDVLFLCISVPDFFMAEPFFVWLMGSRQHVSLAEMDFRFSKRFHKKTSSLFLAFAAHHSLR